MLQPLAIPNAYFWSERLPGHALPANSYLFTSPAGNAVVDPLELDEVSHEQLAQLGGVATVVVTNPDHERASQTFARRYGATIVAEPRDGDELFAGAEALTLAHQKSGREFAVHLRSHRAVVVGDCIVGSPAGALSMLADSTHAGPGNAALGLRRILAANPGALLVGHGHALLSGAYDALYRLLCARAGAQVHRINLDELDFRDERAERSDQPAVYRCRDAEVGFGIGARKLGYRVSILEPGQRFCPLHAHSAAEELFLVLDGEPSVRMLSGTIRCRKGDFVALPAGESGTHQLLNDSDAAATVLLLGRTEDHGASYYPDSDKVMTYAREAFVKGREFVMVRASPYLEYFEGEDGIDRA